MKNNIALSYFIDYMTAIGLFDAYFTSSTMFFILGLNPIAAQKYCIFIQSVHIMIIINNAGCQYFVFFYLNIEGWKVSAEQQLQAIELDFLKTGNSEKQVSWIFLKLETAKNM